MKCPKCDNQIPENSKFCPFCAQKLINESEERKEPSLFEQPKENVPPGKPAPKPTPAAPSSGVTEKISPDIAPEPKVFPDEREPRPNIPISENYSPNKEAPRYKSEIPCPENPQYYYKLKRRSTAKTSDIIGVLLALIIIISGLAILISSISSFIETNDLTTNYSKYSFIYTDMRILGRRLSGIGIAAGTCSIVGGIVYMIKSILKLKNK